MASNGQSDEVLKRSVTQGDYLDNPSGAVFHFMLPGMGGSAELSGFWSYARDWTLYTTIYRESMWAAALYIAVTKQASKGWEVESDIPQRQKRAQELFLHFDNNRGWVSGISKHLQAYLLTGQGGVVEVVRATSAAGSRVLGLIPLDPFRIVRTGDASIPFLYYDRRGGMHEMRDYDAFAITDQPDFQDLWYGVGHCAADRAYYAIQKLEAIERYIYEKVSGKRALALDFVSGVVPTQIEQAMKTAREESAAKGVFTYMGSNIIALAGDQAPTHVRVNLAELPDGFARKEEFDIAVLTYARCIGIPVQDLQPLSGQGLGTGAQTAVLEESSKGQGLATWAKAFGHAANEFSLDDKTTFYFKENDIRDREREAKVRIDEATAIGTWVAMQAITIEQARQLGVDRDLLPQEFIAVDETPGGTLSDSEKPTLPGEVTPTDTEIPVETATQPTEQTAPVVESDAILKDARRIYDRITGREDDNSEHLERMLSQQDRLIDAIVTVKDTIAVERGEIGKVNETLTALQSDATHKALSDTGTLTAILSEIRDAHKAQQSDLVSLRNSMVTLASKEMRVTVANDAKAMRKLAQDVVDLSSKQVADSIASSVSLKHTSDLTVKQEIIEVDRNGLATKVRRTLANNSTQDFRVMRESNGRIKALELIA